MKVQKILKKEAYFIIVLVLLCSANFTLIYGANKPNAGAKFATERVHKMQQDNKRSDKVITKNQVKKFIEKQLKIYGRVAKPQAVFIIPGTNPKVDGLRIDRQFFDLIFRNVVKKNLRHQKKNVLKNKDYIQW